MKIWRMKKKRVSVCCAVGVVFGSADCDLNSFLSEWTEGMRLYWHYAQKTYFIFWQIIDYKLMFDVATELGWAQNSWPAPKYVCH